MSVDSIKLDEIWQKFLNYYKNQVEHSEFNTFYANTKLHSINNNDAIIIVETEFSKLVLNNSKVAVEKAIEESLNLNVNCRFILEDDLTKELSPVIEVPKINLKQNILPEFNFDTFVVGTSNKEAHAAALASSISPGKFITPLFLFGNSGLGKTHLLHAIGNYIMQNSPQLGVYYVPCVDFVNEYIRSIRENKMDDFNQKYFSIDVFLVDDIQFLAGKEKSHEVFFHVFNHLVNNRKQIVITSDRHPEEMSGLENRLVSRFSSGLSIGIDSPEFETALAILQKKIEMHNVDIETIQEDVLYYIASKYSHDVRRLEGALNRLLFYSISFENSAMITMDIALNAFKDFEQPVSITGKLSVEKIMKVVAEYYNLTTNQLISKVRTSKVITARHIAMYLCREELDLPFLKIGEAFGNRDHSTVMSACDKINRIKESDMNYQRAIIELKSLLKTS